MAEEKVSRRRNSVTHIDVVDPTVALDLATAQTYSENVFLFVPNLIGTSLSFVARPTPRPRERH
jgi:hypothetical protein